MSAAPFSLFQDAKIFPCLAYAAGTADRNGTEIDTAGYDTVTIVVQFATIAAGAVTSVKLQQDTVTGMGTAADLLGTGQTVAADDDDECKVIEIHNPRERFLRVVVDKDAANSTAESAVAYLYNGRVQRAIAQTAGSVEGERHVAVAEGTA